MKFMTLEDIDKYKTVFKVPPPIDLCGGFDILKLDDAMRKLYRYDQDREISLANFIQEKYGVGVREFVESMIGKYLDTSIL